MIRWCLQVILDCWVSFFSPVGLKRYHSERKKNEIFTFLQFYWEKVKEIVILSKVLFNLHLSCSSSSPCIWFFFGPPLSSTCSQVLCFKCTFKHFNYLCFTTHICEWPSVKSRNSVRNEWLTPVFRKKSVSLLKPHQSQKFTLKGSFSLFLSGE